MIVDPSQTGSDLDWDATIQVDLGADASQNRTDIRTQSALSQSGSRDTERYQDGENEPGVTERYPSAGQRVCPRPGCVQVLIGSTCPIHGLVGHDKDWKILRDAKERYHLGQSERSENSQRLLDQGIAPGGMARVGLSERLTRDVIEAAQDVCRAVLAHEVSSVSRRTWPAVSDANNRLWQVLKSLGLDPLVRSDEHTSRGQSE